MKMMIVGDPHGTLNELPDCEALVDLIDESQSSVKADKLLILGDLFHNHAILNVSVLCFWKDAFARFNKIFKEVIVLVGNHDLPGNIGLTKVNALCVFSETIIVVDDYLLKDGVLYTAFKYSNNDFIETVSSPDFSNVKTVFCHQTFQGAQYENGFYAQDGIEIDSLPVNQKYISGHIHTPADLGNRIHYVGAPRWRTISDGNIDRYIEVFDFDTQSIIQKIPTDTKCSKIVNYKLEELLVEPQVRFQDVLYKSKKNDRINCEFIGTRDWIESTNKIFEQLKSEHSDGPLMTGKFFYVDEDIKINKVKESDGIEVALIKYVDTTSLKTEPTILRNMVQERILCNQ